MPNNTILDKLKAHADEKLAVHVVKFKVVVIVKQKKTLREK